MLLAFGICLSFHIFPTMPLRFKEDLFCSWDNGCKSPVVIDPVSVKLKGAQQMNQRNWQVVFL
jgi:hypothetical protein